MATIPERLTAVERDLLAQEKANKQALAAHEDKNMSALEAVHVRIDAVEQKVSSFGPVLEGINTSLGILVGDKEKRDTLAEAEAKKKPKTPWDVFKGKLIDSLSTLVAGGILAGGIWVFIQMSKGGN